MITIRPAEFKDYSEIAKLHAESWKRSYRGILSDEFLDHEVERDRLKIWQDRLRYPSSNQVVSLAVKDENIVGFSCLYLDDNPHFGSLLDNLHVSVHYQRSGIGKLLMQNCAKLVLEKGCSPQMYLWVFVLNQNARNVYERLGGVNVETVEKQNEDGTRAEICRYVWRDVTLLF